MYEVVMKSDAGKIVLGTDDDLAAAVDFARRMSNNDGKIAVHYAGGCRVLPAEIDVALMRRNFALAEKIAQG